VVDCKISAYVKDFDEFISMVENEEIPIELSSELDDFPFGGIYEN
jgi:hypothetical protein